MPELRVGAWHLCEGCSAGQHHKHQPPCQCDIETEETP